MCSTELIKKGKMIYFVKIELLLLYITGAIMETSTSPTTVNVPSNTTDPLVIHCTTDRDCPESSYCYPIGRHPVCSSCYDCASRYRQNRIRCARKVQDCGDCLPGYFSDTYAREIRWCKIQVNINAQPHKTDDTVILIDSKWIAVSIICCISVLGLASYCYISSRRHMNINDSISMSELNMPYNYSTSMPAPPPPYSKTHDLGADNTSCSFYLRIEENSVPEQKAIPFSYKHEIATNDGNVGNGPFSNNHASPASGSSAEAMTFSPPNLDIHDENTTPSCWTPGTSYGNVAAQSSQTFNTVKDEDDGLAPPNKRKKTGEDKS